MDARHKAGHDDSIVFALPLHRLRADVAAAEAVGPIDAIDGLIGAALRLGDGLAGGADVEHAAAVVPCSRNALMTLRPTFHLCTSSGPSTSRCERTCVYHWARMVSWLKPSAPCSWIAVSITWCTMCARYTLAIEFSCRRSMPLSAL